MSSVSRSAPPRTPPHSSQRRELRPKARSSASEQKGQVRVLASPFESSMPPPFSSPRSHHNYGPQGTIRHRLNGLFVTSQFGLERSAEGLRPWLTAASGYRFQAPGKAPRNPLPGERTPRVLQAHSK